MKGRSLVRYLRMDWYRLISKKEFYLGIAGVAGALFFSSQAAEGNDVIGRLWEAMRKPGFYLAFIFSAFPYAAAFTDDLESGYIKYVIVRGSAGRYVVSKLVTIMLSAVCVMCAGFLVFAALLAFRFPWMEETSVQLAGRYMFLLREGNYMSWIGLCGIQWGVLSGCLSAGAALISLYLSNRLLVLAAPAMLYQLVEELTAGGLFHELIPIPSVFFGIQSPLTGNDGTTMLLIWAAGMTVGILLGFLSWRKIRKRV